MELEGIMLSEIVIQKKTNILHGITYAWNLKKKSNSWKQRTEKWLPGARSGGNRERLVKGYKLSVIR